MLGRGGFYLTSYYSVYIMYGNKKGSGMAAGASFTSEELLAAGEYDALMNAALAVRGGRRPMPEGVKIKNLTIQEKAAAHRELNGKIKEIMVSASVYGARDC